MTPEGMLQGGIINLAQSQTGSLEGQLAEWTGPGSVELPIAGDS